jgi:ankyrin repeat protein
MNKLFLIALLTSISASAMDMPTTSELVKNQHELELDSRLFEAITICRSQELEKDTAYIDSIQKLINLGANVNALNAVGDTPFWYAVYHALPEVAQLLFDNGADITFKNSQSQGLLFGALRSPYSELSKKQVIEVLLNSGARVSNTEIGLIKKMSFGGMLDYLISARDRLYRKNIVVLGLIIRKNQKNQIISSNLGEKDLLPADVIKEILSWIDKE